MPPTVTAVTSARPSLVGDDPLEQPVRERADGGDADLLALMSSSVLIGES
jgi:hypothetical protein